MNARPVVLAIPGQLLTADTFAPQIQALSGEFELRVADHAKDASIAAMASRLLQAAPASFDILAHAMGGFVAFEVMRTAPERVRSLALLSTLASADGPAQTERRRGYIRLVEEGRFEAVAEERIPLLLGPGRRGDAQLVDLVRSMARATGPETFLQQQRAIMGRVDSRPGLGGIACPTLLVWGEEDGITSRAHQEEMLDAIAGARLEVIAGCGHLPTLEQPAVVTPLLRDWLSARS
jgi:pimeloyl-ACP methyl ester carboxylesterase